MANIVYFSNLGNHTFLSLSSNYSRFQKKAALLSCHSVQNIKKSFIPPLLPVLLGDKEVPGKILSQSPGLILLSSKKLFFKKNYLFLIER